MILSLKAIGVAGRVLALESDRPQLNTLTITCHLDLEPLSVSLSSEKWD